MTIIQNLRQYRIFNMAIFDLFLTLVAAWIIHYLLWIYPLDMKDNNKRTKWQYISSLILIFIMFIGIGVIFHRIFGIKSALSAYLGFNDMPLR